MSMIDLSTRSNKMEAVDQTLVMMWLHRCAAQVTTWPWLSATVVGLALLSAILIPTNLLASQRFHHDEALYATWALEITSGENPLLKFIPIDKPPLFLYTVAGAMWLLGTTETAARLPSLLATGLTVGLIFWLGQKLYSRGVGMLAAWLVALSPFTIFFAPTAFTDPMMVALVLAACLAAVYGRAGWAGVGLGLAIATKQQGLFFIPLVIGLLICRKVEPGRLAGSMPQAQPKMQYLICSTGRASDLTSPAARFASYVSRLAPEILRMLLGMAFAVLPVFIWDLSRLQLPGYWQQSLLNYGVLAANAASFGECWSGFIEFLQYGTASPILNTIFIVGMPLLLLYGIWRSRRAGVGNSTGRVAGPQGRRGSWRSRAGKRREVNGAGRMSSLESLVQVWPATKERIDRTAYARGAGQQLQTGWERQLSYHLPVKPANYQILQLSNPPTDQLANLRQAQTDRLLLLFALAFLLGHALFSFQVWDRYLLGLIPLLALLLARILLLPWSILKDRWLDSRPNLMPIGRVMFGLALGLLLALTLFRPIKDAANARYPLGSNSNALRGIEQITAYLQGHIGANTTLYHRWLGTHWRFYLWNYPYDLQFWSSPQALAARAQPGQLIAFPTWQSETEARLALAGAGLGLQELARAYSPAGHPSLILYRIEAAKISN